MNYTKFQERIKSALSKEFGEVVIKDIVINIDYYDKVQTNTYALQFQIKNFSDSIFEDAEIVEDTKELPIYESFDSGEQLRIN